jgi:endogenous inhibitor of DNA gyrase (YacG/DUF329 family)
MPDPVSNPPCVRCGKPQAVAVAPFCSPGCKDRDLLDWLDERHVLPGHDDDGDDAESLDKARDDA